MKVLRQVKIVIKRQKRDTEGFWQALIYSKCVFTSGIAWYGSLSSSSSESSPDESPTALACGISENISRLLAMTTLELCFSNINHKKQKRNILKLLKS